MKFAFSPIKKSILGFSIVLFFGFCVMNIFWLLINHIPDLPGLYDYKAATLGDGICLPLLTASLIYYIANNNPISKKQKKISFIVGAIVGFLALAWQAEWLINKNTSLNWTIPHQHYFNAAGWYHAAFFVLMFFIIAMYLTQVWFVRRNSKQSSIESGNVISYTSIWFSGIGFVYLIALDDYSSKLSYELLLIIVFLITTLLASLYTIISIKSFNTNCLACVLSGNITAFGISLLLMNAMQINIWLALSGALLSLIFIVYNKQQPRLMLFFSLSIVLPVFILILNILSLKNNIHIIYILIIAPTLIAVTQKFNNKYKSELSFEKHIGFGLLTITLFSLYLSGVFQQYHMFYDLLFTAIAGLIGKKIIKQNFKFIKEEEDKKNSPNFIKKDLRKVKAQIYVLCGAIALGILTVYIFTLISQITINYSGRFISYNWTITNSFFTIIFIVTIILLFSLKNLRSLKINEILKALIVLFLAIIAYCSLIAGFYFLKPLNFIDISPIYICIFFMVIASTLFIVFSFINNSSRLLGKNPDILIILSSIVISLGTSTALTLVLFSNTLSSLTMVNVIISAVFLGLSHIFIPFALMNVIQIKIPHNKKLIPCSPAGAILQDGFLVWIIAICGGIIPGILFVVNTDFVIFIFQILGLVFIMYWFLTFCLKNNVEHIKKRYNEYKNLNDNIEAHEKPLYEKQIETLNSYLRFQNILAFIALLLYSAIPLLIILFIGFVNKKLRLTIDLYIPKKHLSEYEMIKNDLENIEEKLALGDE